MVKNRTGVKTGQGVPEQVQETTGKGPIPLFGEGENLTMPFSFS